MNDNKDEEKKDVSNKELAISNESSGQGLSSFNLFDEKQIAVAEIFLKKIIASEKGGIKSINEGFAILMRAQDLKLPFSTCIEHIHVINGKTGIDIHIIKSLLLRAQTTWELTHDYVCLYEYTDGNNIYVENKLPSYAKKCKTKKEAEELGDDDEIVGVYPVKFYSDYNGVIYRDYQLNASFAIASNKQVAAEIIKSGKTPVYRIPSQPVDFYTEYEFTRYKIINGREIITKAVGHFSYSEALAADLFTKDTYKKYARIMIGNRAFTYGARDIAPDALMGSMETSELKIVESAPLDSTIDFISVEEVN